MRLLRLHPLVWLLVAPAVLCAVSAYTQPGGWQPVGQDELHAQRIYAYRPWQSTGVLLGAGDQFSIRAGGQWSYSPQVGRHGPQGGMWAPDWYPLTGNRDRALGGALIGRVGEEGIPFLVGDRFTGYAESAGYLYLQINDDLLGDNQGTLEPDIEVTPAPDETD